MAGALSHQSCVAPQRSKGTATRRRTWGSNAEHAAGASPHMPAATAELLAALGKCCQVCDLCCMLLSSTIAAITISAESERRCG